MKSYQTPAPGASPENNVSRLSDALHLMHEEFSR